MKVSVAVTFTGEIYKAFGCKTIADIACVFERELIRCLKNNEASRPWQGMNVMVEADEISSKETENVE